MTENKNAVQGKPDYTMLDVCSLCKKTISVCRTCGRKPRTADGRTEGDKQVVCVNVKGLDIDIHLCHKMECFDGVRPQGAKVTRI